MRVEIQHSTAKRTTIRYFSYQNDRSYLEEPRGIDLHFALWAKLWFGSVEPSPAPLIRAALNRFDSLSLALRKRTTTRLGSRSFWWSRRSTSSDHQIVQGLHLLIPWRFFFAWMMCFYCVMCLCHYYLSFSIYSYLQFSIVQRKREQLRAVE